MRISRAEFEERIRDHVEKSIGEVREALKRQGLDPEDVSKVLLVGGSTRVPAVRRALIDLFGEEKVRYEVDPMQAVALGAAILAQHLEGVECPKCKKVNPDDARSCECGESLSAARAATGKLGLHEVTERDLGICAYDKEQDDPDVFVPLIRKGTPYPLPEPVGKTFRIGGRKITIPTYVGANEKASANEYLGVVELELPPDVPAQSSVIVKFNYDRNRILTVGVEFPERSELDFEAAPRRHGLSHPGLGDGKWQIALENTMSYVDRVTEDYGEFLDKERKETVAEEMERARQALRDDDAGAGEQALNSLSHVAQNLGVAGHLFLSQRLSTQADSRTVEQLAVLDKSLREAYRNEDEHGVQQIMRAMEVNFNHIAATVGGGHLQDPRVLLEIVKKEDGE
jgi:molecular chaperone DnaK